jgi:glycosyltransferase involved in cell wall biosynthesis
MIMSDGPRSPDVSVLVATRLRPAQLGETLEGFAAMDTRVARGSGPLRYEVIVVDNGADEATRQVVEQAAMRMPVRRLVEPVAGKNRALNRGLEAACGALVVFTDDDVSVEPEWLRELWEGAARWPDAAMFGGRILPRWPEGAPGREGAARQTALSGQFFDHAFAVADFAHPEGRYSSGYIYGANMAIRAEVFREGWRFDERMGPDGTDRYITGSETSLTVALERRGHHAIYLPGAVVHHRIRPDQLTPAWLHGRAFRKGRAEALKRGLGGGLRHVPREIAAAACREYAAWWRCRLRRDREGALVHGVEYWIARGIIHQCRVSPPPVPQAS